MIDPVRWREDNVVVASLAKIGRLDMRRVFSDCCGAVMAAETVISNVHVIEVGWHPPGRCVAIVTGVRAGDMRRVFTWRDRTVVAGITGADDLRVIDRVRRYKLRRVVAVFAGICRLNVGGRLSRSVHTIVAANAVTGNACVIKNRRYPAIGLVAILALVR